MCAEVRRQLGRETVHGRSSQLKLAYAGHVAHKHGGESALHCRGCLVNAGKAMGSAILWVSAQTAKCHFADCAKTDGTMSVYISHSEIAIWAIGLSARVRLWGNSQKNLPSCLSCRLLWVACFLRERYHGLWRRRQLVVSIGCIQPSDSMSLCGFRILRHLV